MQRTEKEGYAKSTNAIVAIDHDALNRYKASKKRFADKEQRINDLEKRIIVLEKLLNINNG